MRAIVLLLAFVSSAFAYSVTVPNSSQGWTNQGPQTLTWQRVNTDPLNFTALLVNQNISGFQPQVLAALVDGTLGNVSLNPPSGGWTTGSSFRVNLVQDPDDENTIYAQSDEFTISASNSTTSSTGTSIPAATFVTYASSSTSSSPSGSAVPAIGQNNKSGALATYSINIGGITLLAFLSYAFA